MQKCKYAWERVKNWAVSDTGYRIVMWGVFCFSLFWGALIISGLVAVACLVWQNGQIVMIVLGILLLIAIVVDLLIEWLTRRID